MSSPATIRASVEILEGRWARSLCSWVAEGARVSRVLGALLLLAFPATAQQPGTPSIAAPLGQFPSPVVSAAYPVCYPPGEIYDSQPCPPEVEARAARLRETLEPERKALFDLAVKTGGGASYFSRDEILAARTLLAGAETQESGSERFRLISPERRERLATRAAVEIEKRFRREAEEHPEKTAPAAWVYRNADGKAKGDMGLSLSLFARASKLPWMRGRWVTLGAFLGKSTAGFGVAWELTPHRAQVEGEPRRLEIWGGPVAVTPWGSAGDLSLSLGIGFAARM